jgi:superfamily I DNA/RNA helicase
MEIDNPKNISFLQDEEKIEYILKNAYLITTQYRHILVDEAQDLPGNWLSLLYAMLEKCEESNMWIFEDPFQVVRRNTTRQENGNFTKYSLTKVFRNTHNVFEAYQHCYRSLREQVTATEESFSEEELSQPCIDHDVYGLSPHYIRGENDDQLGDALVSTIKVLLNERVPFSDVAVVTCSTEVNHVCKVLESENIMWKDADGRRTSKQNKDNHPPVIVDSYQRFKGLEVKVLIFFIPSGWEPRPMDIYVGFSRSFCHLVVIGNSRMINKIKEDQGD